MAVTIVHRGQIPDPTLKGSCSRCTTVIECLPADCKHSSDPRENNLPHIACPVCQSEIYLTPKRSGPQISEYQYR